MTTAPDSHRKFFARSAGNLSSPEELGVILMNAVLTSASENKLTSPDGKSLVVPIQITVEPVAHEGDAARDGAESTTECHNNCWKVLGHPIFCQRVCKTSTVTAFERHERLTDDALRARVMPGPALRDPQQVQSLLRSRAIRASSAAEAGIMLDHALASRLADGTFPLNEDGTVTIEMTAIVSVPQASDGLVVRSKCTEVCYSILGYDVVCYEVCDTKVAVQPQ